MQESIEDLLRGEGTCEESEEIYRNVVKELRSLQEGTGILPNDAVGRGFLISVLRVVETAQYQIDRIQRFYGKPMDFLDNMVKAAQIHQDVVQASPDGEESLMGKKLSGLRRSVVSGEAWRYAHHFKKVLTGPEEVYEREAGKDWRRYFSMCSAIIESYHVLYYSFLVPNKPVSGESVTGIDPGETVDPFGD